MKYKLYSRLITFGLLTFSINVLPLHAIEFSISPFISQSIEPLTAEDYFYRGFAFYENENYERAIADFTQALKIEEDVVVYYYRGYSYLQLNQYQKSLADANRGMQLDPKDPDFYYLRAINYWILDKNIDAISDLQQAVIMYQQKGDQETVNKIKQMIGKIRSEM